MMHEKIKQLAVEAGFDLEEDGNFYSPPQGQWINQEIYKFAQLMIAEFVPQSDMQTNLIYRLQERARIRRQIPTRLSVQEGKTDRIADLLDEAANELLKYRPAPRVDTIPSRFKVYPLHEEHQNALYSADYKQSMGT
jgi:signal recognition particle subunit SEC65